VTMIGLPNKSLVTQWVAVAAIFVYNIIFGYGWIGVCWLYGPEVSTYLFDNWVRSLNDVTDCSFETPPCWCSRGCFRRMAFLIHHCLRRWNRPAECWLENLDLDGTFLCSCGCIRLLHVP
jgi:hypothetical protein